MIYIPTIIIIIIIIIITKTVYDASLLQTIDVFTTQEESRQPKIFIENLVLHPIKITMSFVQTTLPRKVDEYSNASLVSTLSYIPTFAKMENVSLRLNSFIVEDAMEALPTLISRVWSSYLSDLEGQIARLAGSLAVIGRPVGLARNIGGGVQAFFYEPYLGAIHSPQRFVIGIGIGTGSLVGGVVSGALTRYVELFLLFLYLSSHNNLILPLLRSLSQCFICRQHL